MKKSLTKNYIYNLTYQILVLIVPLITTPYVSRILGPESIGIYSYTISISAYFILFGSLGITLYGQRQIAYEQNDKNKLSITFWEIIIFRAITISVATVLFYIIFIKTNNNYINYYKILIFEIIGNCIDISWFFQGLEEFKKTVIRNIFIKLISIICIFIFVKTREDLYKYFIIYVLSIFLGNLSLWCYLPKYIGHIKIKQLNPIKHFKPTVGLFIPQIAIQVYTLLDRTMIGTIIQDKSQVGYYEQSQKIIKLILTIITSIGTVMLPRIANIYANGEKKEIEKYISKSFNLIMFLALPSIFGLIAISDQFVPIFFGQDYEQVSILIKIITPIILFIGLSNVTGIQYLLPTKRQKEYTSSVICGAIINFVFNLILIQKWGAYGAAVGTIIAEFVVTYLQMYFIKNDFKIINIFKMSLKYLFSSLIMFLVCILIRVVVKNNLLSITMQIIFGGITYLISLIILKDDFLSNLIKNIKEKIICSVKNNQGGRFKNNIEKSP